MRSILSRLSGLPKLRFMFAQRTNLIAGGNATGSESTLACDPERVEFHIAMFDPVRVGAHLTLLPWALPTAIQFNRFAVIRFWEAKIFSPLDALVSPHDLAR
jgi:hypothetical protein